MQFDLVQQLKDIEAQAVNLNDRGFTDASKLLSNLYINISEAKKAYDLKTLNKKQFEEFYTKAIDKAHLVLDQHRSWKGVLYNVASVLISASSSFLINLFTWRFWLFSAETESSKKLNSLKLALDELVLTDDVLQSKKQQETEPKINPPVQAADDPKPIVALVDNPINPIIVPTPVNDPNSVTHPSASSVQAPASNSIVVELLEEPIDKPILVPTTVKEPNDVIHQAANSIQAPTSNSIADNINPPLHITSNPSITNAQNPVIVPSNIPSQDVLVKPTAQHDIPPRSIPTINPIGQVVQIIPEPIKVPEPIVPAVDNKTMHVLQVLKELLNEQPAAENRPSAKIAPAPKKVLPLENPEHESKGNEPLHRDLLNIYKEARTFQKQAGTIVPNATALIPLVSSPSLLQQVNFNGKTLVAPKARTLLSKSGKYLDLATVLIPGILGFQSSPLFHPIKTLNTLIRQGYTLNDIKNNALIACDNLSADISPKIIFSLPNYWDPRQKRRSDLSKSLETTVASLNNLSSKAMKLMSKTTNVDLPVNQFALTKGFTETPLFKRNLNTLASAMDLALNPDYQLPLGNQRAANSFKLLRDLNFLGQSGFFGAMYQAHNALFRISAAPVLVSASKNLLELYKGRDFVTRPLETIVGTVREYFKNSGPWPEDSYDFRLEAYIFLKESMLGKGTDPSLFEFKLRHLIGNLIIQGGNFSSPVLMQLGSLAYIPYHFVDDFLSNSEEYTWYPNFAELLLGDLFGLNPNPADIEANQPANMVPKKVLMHFLNKLIWDQVVVPVLFELPVKGVSTAILRLQVEKMLYNPAFLAKMRDQLNKLLKNVLFNPRELAKAKDFEPQPSANSVNEARKEAVKEVWGAVQDLIPINSQVSNSLTEGPSQKTSMKSLLIHSLSTVYNAKGRFISFMSDAPVASAPHDQFEKSEFNERIAQLIDGTLGVNNITTGKKQQSYVERLAYPVVAGVASASGWAKSLFTNEPLNMLTAIEQATSLAELPKLEEVDIAVENLRDSLKETHYGVTLRKDVNQTNYLIKNLKNCLINKTAELNKGIEEAKKATKALFNLSDELKKLIAEDQNQEICSDTRAKVSQFNIEVEQLITQCTKNSEASYYSNLLKKVPEELDSLIKNKNQHNLNHLCFNLFLQFLEGRISNEGNDLEKDIQELLELIRCNPHSVLLTPIIHDIHLLKESGDQRAFIKNFSDTMQPIIKEIIQLSFIFINNSNLETISLNEFNNLSERFLNLETQFNSLNKTSNSVFVNSVIQSTQLFIDRIRNKHHAIKNSIAAIDRELQPVNLLFEQLNHEENLTLPTKEEISAFKKLIHPSENNLLQPVLVREYTQQKLKEQGREQFTQLVLNKLDRMIDVREHTVKELVSNQKATVIRVKAEANLFREEVQSLMNHFDPDDALFAEKCRLKTTLFDNKLAHCLAPYDAQAEITAALKGLSGYITKINQTTALMSSNWIGPVKPLLTHAELLDVINKATESLKIYVPQHTRECSTVLRAMGLVLLDEAEAVDVQIQVSLTNHLKRHIQALIKTDISDLVKIAIPTMKNSESIDAQCSQLQEKLIQKYCSEENSKIFNTPEVIERFIRKNCKKELSNEKTKRFIETLQGQLTELNTKFHVKPATHYFNFFATQPLSSKEYKAKIANIKKEITLFEPKRQQPFIIQNIAPLIEKPLKTDASQRLIAINA